MKINRKRSILLIITFLWFIIIAIQAGNRLSLLGGDNAIYKWGDKIKSISVLPITPAAQNQILTSGEVWNVILFSRLSAKDIATLAFIRLLTMRHGNLIRMSIVVDNEILLSALAQDQYKDMNIYKDPGFSAAKQYYGGSINWSSLLIIIQPDNRLVYVAGDPTKNELHKYINNTIIKNNNSNCRDTNQYEHMIFNTISGKIISSRKLFSGAKIILYASMCSECGEDRLLRKIAAKIQYNDDNNIEYNKPYIMLPPIYSAAFIRTWLDDNFPVLSEYEDNIGTYDFPTDNCLLASLTQRSPIVLRSVNRDSLVQINDIETVVDGMEIRR